MSLLDAHAEELMAGAMDAPTLAPKRQAPRFSLWGTLSAAPKGLAAGAAEGIGSVADILGAFGQIMGATDGRAGGMFSGMTPKERTDFEKANEKLTTEGPTYRSEPGQLFRNVAKDYMPDPLTAHGAEVVVGDLFRLGGKAVAAGMTLGPVAGAVVAGAEEGFTASDKLAQEGVDIATRTKVGVVTALVTAGSFALPVAGKTLTQTAGLAFAGGPLSYIGQQAATRWILDSADYSKLAEQYDPFDPVGLALSTIIPFGFGAMAMRGARVRAKTKEAENVTNFTERDNAPPPEAVDAARVNLLRENLDNTNPIPEDVDAHIRAYAQAIDHQAAGEKVTVDLPEPAMIRATEAMAQRLEPLRAEIEAILARQIEAPEVSTIPARAEPAPGAFDIGALVAEASRLIEGRTAADAIGELSTVGKVAPELNNALIAAQELGARLPQLVDQFKGLEAVKPGAQPFDLVAEAVERMREGKPIEQEKAHEVVVDPMTARIAELESRNPKALDAEIPVAYDSAGKVTERMTAREYMAEIKRIADLETKDADLLQIAANCFLQLGP